MLRFKARRKDPTESPFLTPSQKRIMSSLGAAMDKVRNAAIRNEGQILDAILHGPPSRLIDLVPENPWYEAQEALQSELTGELLDAGQRYGAAIPSVQKAEVNFRFDADRPEAAAWAQKEAANLIVEVVEEQRGVVRDLAARASMGELTPRDAARQIRDVIGLTNQQAGWVENFRRRQIADLEAQGLSPSRVQQLADRATDKYHRRIHRYRSENIARTEILRASNQGREQAWGQALGEGFISPNSRKQWSANQDDRICPQCRDLNGMIVPLAGTFPGGDPPLHPSCRCDVLLLPEQTAGIEQYQPDTSPIDDLIEQQPSGPLAIAPDWQPSFDPTLATGAKFFNNKVDGPEWGNQKYAAWQEKWEDTGGGEAIREYSSADGESGLNFTAVNRRLRTGSFDPDSFDDLDININAMSQVIDDAVVPEDVIGIRGLTLGELPSGVRRAFEDARPGDLIHDPGFMSISLADKPALGTDIYMRIRVTAGSRGGYLGQLSEFRDMEQELLLQAGTTVRVLKAERSGGRLYVDAVIADQRFGSMSPPDELLKGLLSYRGVMESDDTVTKRGPAPVAPVFDENGDMIQMGQKLNPSAEGIVIYRPASR